VDWISEEPFSRTYKDLYFSKKKATQEANFVFIQGNDLQQRWSNLKKNEVFNIVELGFGAGINFLTTLKTWTEQRQTDNWLNYLSIENQPLTLNDIEKTLKKYDELDPFSAKLLNNYPINCKGLQRIEFSKEKVSLTVYFGEVSSCLNDLDPEQVTFDACFHDGFSPDKNQDMWSSEVFNSIAKLSSYKTTYSTFSSSKIVTEGLKVNGFKAKKIQGFGDKRHMTKATFNLKQNPKTKFLKRNIAIIGAGIAGCSLAKKLNDKGYQVTIFEKNKSLDTGPSAYKALVMYPRLSAFDTPYSLFCLHSYLYSTKFYDALNTSYWNKTGVLLLDFNETTHKRFLQILNSRQDLKLFKKVTREEATEISGIPVPYGGLFFKDAGWLNPNGILKHMLNSPRIKLITGEVTKISKTKVFLEHKDYSFDHICLCSSFESNKLINLKGITKKRGQITYLKKELDIANLKIPICAQGYISPTSEDVLITGSTYSDSDNEDVTLEENLENIERLKLITDQKVKVVDSNFGYRSITQDRLPLLGKSEGIFINISHGSRGTTSAPISAQFICDLIDGSPPIFGKRLIRSLDPERFIKKS